MVVDDNVNCGGSRKRKRVSRKRKLVVNENVEVRSLEEGFLGSWNSGTVIRCGRQQRHVRYDNILEDDGSDYVVDVVTVSAVLDGEGVSSTDRSERGIIRPIPPLVDISKWDLPFALCVDVNHEEAWWEGVVFDQCNGMEERSIFFPDLGDEMKIKFQQLRITQDWDEVSESWKPRGKWVFLELIEECDRVSYVPVSIKQIYYDVRNRDDFVRIKEWTCSNKDLWREPVVEVIGDYNSLTLSEVFQALKLPGNLLIETLEPKANVVSTNVKVDEANNSCMAPDSNIIFPEKETMVQEECVSPVQEVMAEYQEEISGTPCNEKNREGKRTRSRNIHWQPVEVPEVQYCPDVIEQYAFGCESKTIRELLKDNVRKHLAYLGWTIESTEDKEYPGRPRRYRYKPPVDDTQDQEVFNSLLKACNYLQKGSSTPCPQQSQDQDVWAVLAAPPSLSVKDLVEPEYCPEAIVKFYLYTIENRLDDKRKWRLRATKHLLAEGWILEYPSKNRRRALYKSPQNNRLETLQDACRVYLKATIPRWIVSGMRRTLDIAAITEEGVDNDDILECVTQLLGKEPEFNIIDASPARRSTENTRHKHLKTSRGTPTKGMQNRSPTHVVQPCKRAQKVPAPSQSLPKPQNVISWLIDRNILVTRSKVFYRANRGRDPPVAEGRLIRDGIKCSCCQEIYGLNGFATHATGSDDCCRPSGNIFLKDGRSLLDCQIEVMHDDRTSETTDKPTTDLCDDENENSCSVCQSGGDLILCDQCPSAFHKECLGLEDIPDGDWFCPLCHCPNCCKSTTGRTEEGQFLTCSQCEHKYHVGCVRNRMTDQSRRHPEQWLCGKECEQIYAGLHKLLGKPVSVGATDNLTWTLLKFVNSESSDVGNTTDDFLAECYSKLSVAVSVMHECFEPVNSPSSTRDLAEDIIFSRWSKLPRSNYQGFYTILLERNEELISVANIRVYGEKVAEIPLVGTRFQYRRLGMCRILMNELEKMLMKLGVKRLVLPAVPDTLETWTKSFGFVKMTSSERSQFLDHIFLDFPETIMCQKVLTRSPSPDSDLTSEIQPKAPDVLSVKCRIEFDKSSSASEEEHAEKIHKRKRISCIEEGKQMVEY
ncbi:hypothetical protein RIF29_17139 [Crotalaria pallida]|uniref:Uncharacterized protein n=1 Tax=Crotalaria pallida TaxID=3830 RepID=A0AAN9IF21_CROPI